MGDVSFQEMDKEEQTSYFEAFIVSAMQISKLQITFATLIASVLQEKPSTNSSIIGQNVGDTFQQSLRLSGRGYDFTRPKLGLEQTIKPENGLRRCPTPQR